MTLTSRHVDNSQAWYWAQDCRKVETASPIQSRTYAQNIIEGCQKVFIVCFRISG